MGLINIDRNASIDDWCAGVGCFHEIREFLGFNEAEDRYVLWRLVEIYGELLKSSRRDSRGLGVRIKIRECISEMANNGSLKIEATRASTRCEELEREINK